MLFAITVTFIFIGAGKTAIDVMLLAGTLIFALFFFVAGLFIIKRTVIPLLDNVYEEGASIILKNGNCEIRVNLTEIKYVDVVPFFSPQRVTLFFKNQTPFGNTASFVPKIYFVPFILHPDVKNVISRIRSK